MRILLPIHSYPPYHVAGSEIYTSGIAQAMTPLDAVEVAVMYPVQNPDAKRVHLSKMRDEYGVLRYEINGLCDSAITRSFGAGLPEQAAFMRAFDEALDDFNPDLLHFQQFTGYPARRVIESVARRGIPTILSVRDHWLLCPSFHYLRSDNTPCAGPKHGRWSCAACMSGRVSLDAADAVFAPLDALGLLGAATRMVPQNSRVGAVLRRDSVILDIVAQLKLFVSPSQSLPDRLIARGLPLGDVRVVRNGHRPPQHVERIECIKRAPGGPLRVGYLGTFIPGKAPHVLLDAAALLAREAPGEFMFRLHGYGVDAYGREIERRAASMDGVQATGRYERGDLGAMLAALDCVVAPSVWYENAPLVIDEAFLHGVPVVASNLGGMAESLHNGEAGGLLFEPGDAHSLAGALLRLAREPGLLAQLRTSIPRVPLVEEHVQQLLALYYEVLEDKPRINTSFLGETCHL